MLGLGSQRVQELFAVAYGQRVARDIGGSDPERTTALKVAECVRGATQTIIIIIIIITITIIVIIVIIISIISIMIIIIITGTITITSIIISSITTTTNTTSTTTTIIINNNSNVARKCFVSIQGQVLPRHIQWHVHQDERAG